MLAHASVLVILDRNVDLVPMLSHSWTYQALVNDVLGMKLNRVTVEVRAQRRLKKNDSAGRRLISSTGSLFCRDVRPSTRRPRKRAR